MGRGGGRGAKTHTCGNRCFRVARDTEAPPPPTTSAWVPTIRMGASLHRTLTFMTCRVSSAVDRDCARKLNTIT
jgi:hypothetical protein